MILKYWGFLYIASYDQALDTRISKNKDVLLLSFERFDIKK